MQQTDNEQKKKLLGLTAEKKLFKRPAVYVAALAILGVIAYSMSSGAVKPSYMTRDVSLGNLRVTVSADDTQSRANRFDWLGTFRDCFQSQCRCEFDSKGRRRFN